VARSPRVPNDVTCRHRGHARSRTWGLPGFNRTLIPTELHDRDAEGIEPSPGPVTTAGHRLPRPCGVRAPCAPYTRHLTRAADPRSSRPPAGRSRRGGRSRTGGLQVPNLARCQLRYAPMWTAPESNRTPLPCEGSALPDELVALDVCPNLSSSDLPDQGVVHPELGGQHSQRERR
jgi:hypothetical protein